MFKWPIAFALDDGRSVKKVTGHENGALMYGFCRGFQKGHFGKGRGEDLSDRACCITVRKIVFSNHNSFQTYLLSLSEDETRQGFRYKVSEIMSSHMAVMTV